MKGKLVSCVVVLAWLIIQAMPVMADGTDVTGTVPLVTSDVSVSNIGSLLYHAIIYLY